LNEKVKIARLAGLLYLLIIGFGLIAQIFVRDSLVDYNDASITANNIMASEFWFRLGFVSELFMLISDIGVTTILYIIFKDFNRNLALLSTFYRLTSIIILCVVALSHYAALFFLKGSEYLTVFDTNQLDAFSLLSIKMHGSGYNICLLFFGFHLIFLGYLIYKSAYFPRIIAYLLIIGGLCYFINSITWFLFPNFVKMIYPAILIPCSFGELLFSLWLLFKGVKIKAENGT
jgi:hypothetical protein